MSKPLFVAVAEDNIEERIDKARAKWSNRLGEDLDDVPWSVVFLSDRELTPEQYHYGAVLAKQYGLE